MPNRTRTDSARSSRWGVAVLVVVFLAVIASLVYVGSVGLEVLTSVRAFVGGEGLWSKAERDAVSALSRYITSGDEAHFREFQSRLAVPLGDRAAREALDEAPPDFAKAREGFLKGRNHPSDVDGMSRLFVRFRRFEHMARAISIWERADTLIARLAKLGEDAHRLVSTGELAAGERAALLREVEAINGEVTPLEDAFSATLGEAARWVRDVLQRAMLALTILLVAFALAAAYRIGSFLHLLEGSLLSSALHDPLTGLPNRVLFSDRLALAIRHAEREGQRLAVMFLDLDDFKKVNDSLGHAAGDEVLIRVSERLRACLRGDDTVARVGGDEFIFLAPGAVRRDDIAGLAEKILALLSEPLTAGGRPLRMTASLGIGVFPDDGADAESLVANVDVAMYRAKDAGGNAFRFFGPDLAGVSDRVRGDEALRVNYDAEFPARRSSVQFNHAAVCPLPARAAAALGAYARNLAERGGLDWRDWPKKADEVRALAARLIGCDERTGGAASIAIVPNTSYGLNLVASGFPFAPGDSVVTTATEFPANLAPWAALAPKGVTVRRVPTRDGAFSAADVEAACDATTRLVSVSLVAFHTGFRAPAEEIAAFCRTRGIVFGLDAIQAVGAQGMDVAGWGVDFLSADGHKWMLGPEGAGILFTAPALRARLTPPAGWTNLDRVSPTDYRVPEAPRFRSDGVRFEPGALPTPGLYALAASLALLLEIGFPEIEARIARTLGVLVDGLPGLGFAPVLFGTPPRSGILAARPPAGKDARYYQKRAAEENVVISAREGFVRFSPHVGNDEGEAERVLALLRKL